MKLKFSEWSINQKLALFVFLLGFVAMFMRDPSKARIVSVDASELALIAGNKSANISVDYLADQIIQKAGGFVLVDVRSESKFNEYSIPTAINCKPSEILKLDLPKTDKIVIFSDDNIQSALSWYLLRSSNYKAVYILSGGINEWKDKILFPLIPDSASAELKSKADKAVEISKFFGGMPRFASAGTASLAPAPQQAMPKVAAPPPPPAGKAAGKSKREGC